MREAAHVLLSEVQPKWNVAKVAEATGVSRPTVYKWIRGTALPTYEQIVALEKILPHCHRDLWLVERPQPQPKEDAPHDEIKSKPRRTRRGRP